MPNRVRSQRSTCNSSTSCSGSEFQVYHPYHSQGLAAGGSALLDAINRGKVHLAKFILDAGELDIVNTRDFKGKTPLIRTCYIKEEKTRLKAIQLLLSRGCDVNLRDDSGRTAFSYACELRCNDIVQVLIRNNVDPDIPDNEDNTPLIFATMAGNDIAVELIVRSFRRLGLNVDHANKRGMTALLIAVDRGHIECATVLATDGRANINAVHPISSLTAEQLAVTSTGYSLRRPPVVWPSKMVEGPSGHQSADEEDFEAYGRTRRVVSLTGLTMPGVRSCGACQWSKPDCQLSGKGSAVRDVITESDYDDVDAMGGIIFGSNGRLRNDESQSKEVSTTTDSKAVRICCDGEEITNPEDEDEVDCIGEDENICKAEVSSLLEIDTRRHLRRTSLPARRVYVEQNELSKVHQAGVGRHQQEGTPSDTASEQVCAEMVKEARTVERLAIVDGPSDSKQSTNAGN